MTEQHITSYQMNFNRILELERKHREQVLAYELNKARDEIKQQTLNACISIISTQMSLNATALLYSALRDD